MVQDFVLLALIIGIVHERMLVPRLFRYLSISLSIDIGRTVQITMQLLTLTVLQTFNLPIAFFDFSLSYCL